ncbi:hypothetical protein R3P38DRAFT_2766945 [Favolaschia claudopus]|uniref:Ribosomal protein S3 n=1 Tax=Favolaschia claudopus TaxID=2862362 RepID=A0AAW0CWK7_9AGAR
MPNRSIPARTFPGEKEIAPHFERLSRSIHPSRQVRRDGQEAQSTFPLPSNHAPPLFAFSHLQGLNARDCAYQARRRRDGEPQDFAPDKRVTRDDRRVRGRGNEDVDRLWGEGNDEGVAMVEASNPCIIPQAVAHRGLDQEADADRSGVRTSVCSERELGRVREPLYRGAAELARIAEQDPSYPAAHTQRRPGIRIPYPYRSDYQTVWDRILAEPSILAILTDRTTWEKGGVQGTYIQNESRAPIHTRRLRMVDPHPSFHITMSRSIPAEKDAQGLEEKVGQRAFRERVGGNSRKFSTETDLEGAAGGWRRVGGIPSGHRTSAPNRGRVKELRAQVVMQQLRALWADRIVHRVDVETVDHRRKLPDVVGCVRGRAMRLRTLLCGQALVSRGKRENAKCDVRVERESIHSFKTGRLSFKTERIRVHASAPGLRAVPAYSAEAREDMEKATRCRHVSVRKLTWRRIPGLRVRAVACRHVQHSKFNFVCDLCSGERKRKGVATLLSFHGIYGRRAQSCGETMRIELSVDGTLRGPTEIVIQLGGINRCRMRSYKGALNGN